MLKKFVKKFSKTTEFLNNIGKKSLKFIKITTATIISFLLLNTSKPHDQNNQILDELIKESKNVAKPKDFSID